MLIFLYNKKAEGPMTHTHTHTHTQIASRNTDRETAEVLVLKDCPSLLACAYNEHDLFFCPQAMNVEVNFWNRLHIYFVFVHACVCFEKK